MNADKIEKTLPNLGPIYPFILMFINTLTKEKTNEQIFCFRSQRDLNALIFWFQEEWKVRDFYYNNLTASILPIWIIAERNDYFLKIYLA